MYSRTSTGLRRRKSSGSGSEQVNCVEVARTGEVVAIRDSMDPDGPVLTVTPAVFAAFLTRTTR